jgi:hypothetical protein
MALIYIQKRSLSDVPLDGRLADAAAINVRQT